MLSQRMMLEKYAADNGFENTFFLSDNGYSSTDFDRRPAGGKLMELVESGEVATIIVKDMSRLGRNHLMVGHFTEMIFPSYGIRFIAINNHVDSLCGENDFTPFVDLFNDFYSKGTSRKIRAVKKAKAERGERIASRPLYGHRKSENDMTNVAQFVEKAKRYRNITELTPERLHLFIEKIVVGEKSKKYSCTAKQEICIYYRDIGLMDEPEEHSGTQGRETEEAALDLENGVAVNGSPTAATDTDPAA